MSVLCLLELLFVWHPYLTDGFNSTPCHHVSPQSSNFIITLRYRWIHLHGHVTPSCACRPILFVVSGLCRRSLVPCPSLQHWDQGGGNSEEPERLIAHTGLQAGPQSALLSAPSGPEPKPAHRLGVPQHSLPAGQTPLQLSLRPPSFIFLSLFPSLQLSQHFLSLFIFTFSSCG